jgi:hypothetical protein
MRALNTPMMEVILTSETSVYFNNTTRRHIPEGYYIFSRRHENLKSHNIKVDLKEIEPDVWTGFIWLRM